MRSLRISYKNQKTTYQNLLEIHKELTVLASINDGNL